MRTVPAYGLPWMGSKNKLAKRICSFLPKRNRLVDLFGGGGAVSDYALSNGFYSKVLYREKYKDLGLLFQKITSGNELEWNFTSREDFYGGYDFDRRLCWSFSSDIRTYFTSVERLKTIQPIIEYVINRSNLHGLPLEGDCLERYQRWLDSGISKTPWIRPFDNQKRLTLMARRYKTNKLFKPDIEVELDSYETYNPQDGDVVYADPPYVGTDCSQYKTKWKQEDYDQLCKWGQSLQVPFFVSEYRTPCVKHRIVFQCARQNLMFNNKATCNEFLFEILR